jgi:hypothetical protein
MLERDSEEDNTERNYYCKLADFTYDGYNSENIQGSRRVTNVGNYGVRSVPLCPLWARS